MEASIKKNATMLTMLMLVKKGLSIVYKIPYQNLTGDAGFYVFQQVYPFMAILMLLTGFALPTVIGSLLAENHYSGMIKDKLKRGMWIVTLAIFIILFLGNRQIALIMGDILLAPVIRITGVHFLFLPPIAYMRGVLQSRPNTIKRFGYSVVIEQISRVSAVLVVLYAFDTHHHSYYRIAFLAVLFSLISPVVTIIHLYLMKPIDDATSFLTLKEKPQFFHRTMYLMLGSGVLVIFSLVDSFLVFNMLITTQTQVNAMVLRGVLERGLPLVQAGTFFVGSLVSLIMLQFEQAKHKKQKKIALRTGLFYILALATPVTVGLIHVMPYLNVTLFTNQYGNDALQMMMIQIVLYSVIVVLTAILSREERQSFVLVALLIGFLTKLLLTAPLVYRMGIEGAALSSVLSLLIMCLLMLIGTRYLFTPKLFMIVIGISLSSLFMWLGLHYISPFLAFLNTGERSGYLSLLLVNVVIGLLIYSLMMFMLIGLFKAIGKAILLRHEKRRQRVEKAARARDRMRSDMLKLQEAQMQEAQRLQKEALERERYRQSLMHNKPKPAAYVSPVTVDDQLEARGYVHHQSRSEQQQSQLTHSQIKNEPINQIRKERKKMRLDKFLKVSRIIKRRQTAKEVSDAGKISVNGKIAKSSTALQVGDEIALHYATRTLVVKVMVIKDSTKKEDARLMYEVVREEATSSSN